MTTTSLPRHGRAILSVIGPHSGCGKTLFTTHLICHVNGLGCLKISPARDWPERVPDGNESIEKEFFLEDSAHLDRPGKDTALYRAAGAAHVERLRHRRDGLAAGLKAALDRFAPTMPIVVESSSAVPLLSPVAVVLIVRPPLGEMKQATRDILAMVTDLFVNASDGAESATSEAGRLCKEFPSLAPQFTWSADLIFEPPPAEMLTRLGRLLTANSTEHGARVESRRGAVG